MAFFGGYEPVRELSLGRRATVFVARKSGSAEERFVAKVLEPLPGEEGDQAARQAREFLGLARAQQKVAAQAGSHWAPIHEMGQTAGGGAFYISDRFDRSARDLIEGFVRVSDSALHNIVRSAVAGLAELRAVCGRPHGAVNPSNLLIAGGGQLAAARVALTDPAPAGGYDPQKGYAEDLRALGELVYHLVLHRPVPARGFMDVPTSQEWDQLGPQSGDAWRAVCSRLLSAGVAQAPIDLEQLVAELPQPAASKGRRRAIYAAAGLVLLAVAAGLFVLHLRNKARREAVFEPEKWGHVCQFYPWASNLERDLEKEPAQRNRWRQDANLRKVLDAFAEAKAKGVLLDPRAIAGKDAYITEVPAWADNPPPEAKTPKAIELTRKTHDLVRRIEDLLSPKEWPSGQWAARGHLGALWMAAKEERDNGSVALADYYESLLRPGGQGAGARPKGSTVLLAIEVDKALNTDPKSPLQALRSLADQVARAGTFSDGSGELQSRFLPGFGEGFRKYMGEQLGQKRPEELIKECSSANHWFTQLTAFVSTEWANDKVDRALFVESKEGEAGLKLSGSLEESGKAWLAAARGFARVPRPPPPATQPDFEAGLATVGQLDAAKAQAFQQRWAKLKEEIGDLGRVPAIVRHESELNSRTAELKEQVGGLESEVRAAGVDPRPGLDAAMVKIEAELNALQGLKDAVGFTELSRPVGEIRGGSFWKPDWKTSADRLQIVKDTLAARERLVEEQVGERVSGRVEAVRKVLGMEPGWAAGSKSLAEQWSRRRGELLSNAKLLAGPQLTARVVELESLLASVGQSLPGGLAGGVAAGGKFADDLTALIGVKREACLEKMVGWVQMKADGTAVLDSSLRQRSQDEFMGWYKSLGPLAGDLRQIEGLLDAGYGYSESGGAVGVSIERLYDKCRSVGAWKEVGPLWQASEVRVKHLGEVEQGLSRAELLAEVKGGVELGSSMSAWEALGRGEPGWPGDVKSLEEEAGLEEGLKGRIVKSGLSAERKQSLTDRLTKGGPLRWLSCFEGLAGRDELKAAVGVGARLGVSMPGDLGRLKERSRFNYLLLAFSERDYGKLKDEEILSARDEFTGSVVRQCGSLSGQGVVKELLAKMSGLKPPEKSQGDFGTVGPGMKGGWTHKAEGNGKSVSYSWTSRGTVLQFVRVEGVGGRVGAGRAFFLCVTEVTTGLFADAFASIADEGQKTGLREGLATHSRTELRQGAWGWEWSWSGDQAKGIRAPGARWLDTPPEVGDPRNMYPAALQGKVAEPTRNVPMQRISAEAAERFALLLGSRLPTADEWQAAYEAYEKARPAPRWNLRDKTWGEQQKHVSEKEKAGISLKYPDAGIFWPDGKAGKEGAEAELATQEDDGVLWFAESDSDKGRTLHHLVGNVAEYVKDGGKFCVIGGSALSPPRLADGRAYAVDQAYPLADGKRTFSDVGLRLAFDAPQMSLAEQIAEILKKKDYFVSAQAAGSPPGN